MAITAQTAANWASLSLASSDAISAVDIVNQAGEILVNAHQWSWLAQRSARITPRANISVVGDDSVTSTAGISSDTAGKRISFEGTVGIEDYVFNVGDKLDLTAQSPVPGANQAVLGEYKIVAKVADDVVIIESSANVPGSGRFSYVSGKITTDSIALPVDFRDLIAIEGQQTNWRTLRPTTLANLLRMRSYNTTSSSQYWGALNYASHKRTEYGSGAGSGSTSLLVEPAQAPVPILEIWPDTAAEYLTYFYRAGWTPATSDDSYLLIPAWMEPCFLQLVQHVAHGHLERDERPMANRIMEWQMDPITVDAKRRDGQLQGNYGTMRGGAAQRQGYGHHPMDSDHFTVTF